MPIGMLRCYSGYQYDIYWLTFYFSFAQAPLFEKQKKKREAEIWSRPWWLTQWGKGTKLIQALLHVGHNSGVNMPQAVIMLLHAEYRCSCCGPYARFCCHLSGKGAWHLAWIFFFPFNLQSWSHEKLMALQTNVARFDLISYKVKPKICKC